MRFRHGLVLLLAALAACDEGPASPELRTRVAELFREGAALEVGEVLTATAAEAGTIILPGFADGAEYVYIPFNASEDETARLQLEVRGTNVLPPGSASASRAGGQRPAAIPAPGDPREEEGWHMRLRQREIRELTPLVRAAAASPRFGAARAARIPASPAVGDVLEINAGADQPCREPDLRRARVAAVSDRAIVVEDLANPAGGFSDEEYRNVAEVFDTLIYPVDVRNFGEPVFADFITPGDRIILFYTRAVNDLTPAGSDSYVGGFFFGRDLFPREATSGFEACPASNAAPIMYLLAPDPQGEAGSPRSRDFVLRVTLATVAHEFQHLINQARRLFVTPGAQPFEEVWLNEGLSHVAEELMFYQATRLGPRQNIGVEELLAAPRIQQLFVTYQISNFGRYITYLENPDTTSLIGVDDLPTRGASWAFLRYAADQEPGEDAVFFRRLVDGVEAGVANLANALPVDPIDLMQTWTVSVYTDDALPQVDFPLLYQQPSWDFRSIVPALQGDAESPRPAFPLRVTALTGQEETFQLRPGGAAYLRFRVPAGEDAVIRTTAGGAVPGERLRISVVRID